MLEPKDVLRKEISAIRDCLSRQEILSKSYLIGERLFALSEFKSASLIMFYVSFRSEVETAPMIREALSLEKQIAVPAVNLEQKELELFAINDLIDLEPGAYGIPEPKEKSKPVRSESLELIIVPGCVFDHRGFRLGYGAGYYDKLLAKVPGRTSIGLSFECQLVSEILHIEPHDIPLKMIITEKRVIDCQQSDLK